MLPCSDKSESDQSQRSKAVMAQGVIRSQRGTCMWGCPESDSTDNLSAVLCFGGGTASTFCSAAAETSLVAI
jgi:hypothetical protein